MSSKILDAIPVNKLCPKAYYIIRNIKGTIPSRYGMHLYTFVINGKNYARFTDLEDETKKEHFHELDEVSYGDDEWTFHYI